MTTTLIQMTQASRALAKATTLQDVLNVKDVAAAMKTLLAQQGQSLQLQNQAAELKLRAERKAGTLLSEMELKPGVKSINDNVSSIDSLESLGITPKQSSRWQQEAKVSDEDFAKMVVAVNESGEELTQSKLLKLARGAHVGNNSCDNEWYTPEAYIQPFRDMIGGIDLDPASCEFANRQVKAKRFYSIDNDGLAKQWKGTVWLNPPYGAGVVDAFADKVVESWVSGKITHMAVLVNNATETKWFQKLLPQCSAVCLLASRIKFLKPSEETNSPLQGQCIVYFGDAAEEFAAVYSELGFTLFTKRITEFH